MTSMPDLEDMPLPEACGYPIDAGWGENLRSRTWGIWLQPWTMGYVLSYDYEHQRNEQLDNLIRDEKEGRPVRWRDTAWVAERDD